LRELRIVLEKVSYTNSKDSNAILNLKTLRGIQNKKTNADYYGDKDLSLSDRFTSFFPTN
jgi:hypothetical protein